MSIDRETIEPLAPRTHPDAPADERAHGHGGDTEAAPGAAVGPAATTGSVEDTIDAAERLLDEVEQALTRLDEGSYGRCGSCGGPIEPARLADEPLARRCAACAAMPSSNEATSTPADPAPGSGPVTPD